MKIKNCTSTDIIIVNENNEFCCESGATVNFTCETDEIYIRSAVSKPLSEHIKVFKTKEKDDIRGMITFYYFGFDFEYETKITVNSAIKALNITEYCFAVHDLIVCKTLIPKEKVKTENFFNSSIIRRLLLLFVSFFAVPTCGVSGGLTLLSVCGIFGDFSWSGIVASVFLASFFCVFVSISRDLYCMANPQRNYAKILEKGKQIIINKKSKHFLSFKEVAFKE